MENIDKSMDGKHAGRMAGASQSVNIEYLQAIMDANTGISASNTSTNGDLLDDGLVNMPGMRIEGKVVNVRGKDGKVYKNGEQLKCGCAKERISDGTQRAPERAPVGGIAIAPEKATAMADNDDTVSSRDVMPDGKFIGTGWDVAAKADAMAMVKHCAKGVLLFGGMEALFFYWQQTKQMVDQTAYLAIVVCATLAGLSVGIGIGKYIRSTHSK